MKSSLPAYYGRKLKFYLWDLTRESRRRRGLLPAVEKPFFFDGQSFEYFDHRYNRSRRGERCIEMPIARQWLDLLPYQNLLEVGNVAGWYENYMQHHLQRTIIDRYEKGRDILNIDIRDFHYGPGQEKFDAILSISTIEHIDGDPERNTSYGKSIDQITGNEFQSMGMAAVAHLYSLLAEGGEMLITIPLGFSHIFDRAYENGTLFQHSEARPENTRSVFFRRLDRWFWEESDYATVKNLPYGDNGANAMLFWFFRK